MQTTSGVRAAIAEQLMRWQGDAAGYAAAHAQIIALRESLKVDKSTTFEISGSFTSVPANSRRAWPSSGCAVQPRPSAALRRSSADTAPAIVLHRDGDEGCEAACANTRQPALLEWDGTEAHLKCPSEMSSAGFGPRSDLRISAFDRSPHDDRHVATLTTGVFLDFTDEQRETPEPLWRLLDRQHFRPRRSPHAASAKSLPAALSPPRCAHPAFVGFASRPEFRILAPASDCRSGNLRAQDLQAQSGLRTNEINSGLQLRLDFRRHYCCFAFNDAAVGVSRLLDVAARYARVATGKAARRLAEHWVGHVARRARCRVWRLRCGLRWLVALHGGVGGQLAVRAGGVCRGDEWSRGCRRSV